MPGIPHIYTHKKNFVMICVQSTSMCYTGKKTFLVLNPLFLIPLNNNPFKSRNYICYFFDIITQQLYKYGQSTDLKAGLKFFCIVISYKIWDRYKTRIYNSKALFFFDTSLPLRNYDTKFQYN